jgi:hypothetical protein
MYKFKVKISTQQGDRYVELDRGRPSYAHLRSEVERRTKQQGQWFLKAGARAINNDEDLVAAIVEAESALNDLSDHAILTFFLDGGAHYLDVQLQGGVAPRPAHTAQPTYSAPPVSSYQAPAPTYQQPSYSAPPPQQYHAPQPTYQQPAQPTYQQPTHHAPPAATSGASGRFTTFEVYGNPSAPGKPSFFLIFDSEWKNPRTDYLSSSRF